MNKQKKGMSLIELMIAMSLLVIISIVIGSIYITGFKTYRQELAQSSIQSNAQTILDSIINDAKNAQSVEETYNTYTSGVNSVILRVPAIDSDKNILYSGSSMLFDRIIYYFEDNAIHKVTYADSSSVRFAQNGLNKTLDNNILKLEFAYDPDILSTTLLTATVSTNQQVGKINRNIALIGKARLRNHL